jgi:hypothetical protein
LINIDDSNKNGSFSNQTDYKRKRMDRESEMKLKRGELIPITGSLVENKRSEVESMLREKIVKD